MVEEDSIPDNALVVPTANSSNALYSLKQPARTCISNKKVVHLDHVLFNWGYSRRRCRIKLSLLADGNLSPSCRLLNFRRNSLTFRKSRRRHICPFASADDGVTVNGSPQASTSSNVNEIRVKLDQSLENKDYSDGLVHLLHDAARVFELAFKEHRSSLKISWFSTAWLGVDKNGWVKTLSYQVCVSI
ncbi:hypothetical protein U1Q18_014210 [Sarracenia purpurea var. burkii]